MKKRKKKPAPKRASRPVERPRAREKHEIVVRVEAPAVPTASELIAPIQDGGKLMMPKTWMSERQASFFLQRTPPQHVYRRPAKGGGTWEYVTGAYVEKALNFAFGWNWDFEVVQHGKEGDIVWVLGRLTVKDSTGTKAITKSQFGRAEIKKMKTGGMLDFGNDLKAATTDSLKKCASMLGIASDIYGKKEYREESGREVQPEVPPTQAPPGRVVAVPAHPIVTPKMGQVKGPDGTPVYVCSDCSEIVNDVVGNFSMKVYGTALCATHQKDHKPKR